MNLSQKKVVQQLLELLIDTQILPSLIKGEYFNESEYKVIKKLTLEHFSQTEFANLLTSHHPTWQSNNKRNQLIDKILALVPLHHVEILNANSSWVIKNLNFGMQSAISDYLSRTNKPTFIALKKVLEPKSIEELNYDNLSIAQFEIAKIKSESKSNEVTKSINELNRVRQRLEETLLEAEVTLHYNSLIRHFQKKVSLNKEYADEALNYYNKYSYLISETDNIRIYFYVSLIGVFHSLLIPDYQLLTKRCESTLSGLENNFAFRNDTYIRVLRYRLIEGYIQIGQYQKAMNEVSKINKLTNLVSKVRHALLKILVYIKSEQYEEAVLNYFEIDTPYIRQKLTGGIRYNLELTRNLIYIIAALKEMNPIYLPVKRTMQTMLNIDSEYYRDKSGLNLAQIVTKWVLLVMNRDTRTMESSETALERYLARHVRDKKNYRAKCMLRMLKAVYKSNYNVDVIKRRTSISYNRLKQSKPDGTFQAMELEIISYEKLWHLLLEYLAAGKKIYD